MNEKNFASQGDLGEKRVSFTELAPGAYAYTAEGDPNSGIIVGDDGVMVIDTQATPAMAEDVIARVREVTDKPIKYVVLSHYHAVRVLGASAYGAEHIIASRGTCTGSTSSRPVSPVAMARTPATRYSATDRVSFAWASTWGRNSLAIR